MSHETKRIEYLCAYEDGTWQTIIETIPSDAEPVAYAETVLSQELWARKIVLFAVYNSAPDCDAN